MKTINWMGRFGIAAAMVGSLIAAGAFAGQRSLQPLKVSGATNADGATPVVLDAAEYLSIRKGGPSFTFDIPIDDRASLRVRVSKLEIFAENAVIVVGGESGDVRVNRPDVVLLTGSVAGDAESHVFLSLSPHGVNGQIEVSGHRYVISAGPYGGPGAMVYDLDLLPADVIQWQPFQCAADLLPRPPKVPRTDSFDSDSVPAGDPPCRVANLAIETDYEYTANIFGGNTEASAAYAATLVAAGSEVATSNLNVRYRIVFLRTWSSNSDPYTANNSWDRFFQYQDHWNANMRNIVRNGVHMLSALRDGSIGGLAYLPGLCQQDYDYAYSAYLNGTFPYPLRDHDAQNWDPFVFTHEEGHNLGAPHTHDMSPPVDRCGFGDCSQAYGGTVMSYCHICSGGMTNIALKYHQRTVDEAILPYLANEAPCNLTNDPDCGFINCDLIARIKVVCGARQKLKGIVKSVLPSGTKLTLTRDGASPIVVTINTKGKGKAVWPGSSVGSHTVCVIECPNICGTTTCNP